MANARRISDYPKPITSKADDIDENDVADTPITLYKDGFVVGGDGGDNLFRSVQSAAFRDQHDLLKKKLLPMPVKKIFMDKGFKSAEEAGVHLIDWTEYEHGNPPGAQYAAFTDVIWRCPLCTYDNKPTAEGCDMCGVEKPPQQVEVRVGTSVGKPLSAAAANSRTNSRSGSPTPSDRRPSAALTSPPLQSAQPASGYSLGGPSARSAVAPAQPSGTPAQPRVNLPSSGSGPLLMSPPSQQSSYQQPQQAAPAGLSSPPMQSRGGGYSMLSGPSQSRPSITSPPAAAGSSLNGAMNGLSLNGTSGAGQQNTPSVQSNGTSTAMLQSATPVSTESSPAPWAKPSSPAEASKTNGTNGTETKATTPEAAAAPAPTKREIPGQGFALSQSPEPQLPPRLANPTPRLANVDERKQTASVQIVLANREKIRQKFNTTHSIADIYAHVASFASSRPPFMIYCGFPPRALIDPDMKVANAGLDGSSLTVKPVKSANDLTSPTHTA